MTHDASIEAVAARLWKAQIEGSGTPASVINARTPETFAEESDKTREVYIRYAKAAVEVERRRIVRAVYMIAHNNRQPLIGDKLITAIRYPERKF